jgi:hypothetical protein
MPNMKTHQDANIGGWIHLAQDRISGRFVWLWQQTSRFDKRREISQLVQRLKLFNKNSPTQDNTTYKHKRQTSMPSAVNRTRDPSNQEAAGLRLRPRGHWDQEELRYRELVQDAT